MKSDKNKPNPVVAFVIAALILGTLAAFLLILFITSNNRSEETNPSAAASQSAITQGNREREAWPILEKLPYENALYTISYGIKDGDLLLTVDTNEAYLNSAIKKLNSLGSSDRPAAAYRVQITGLATENPFTDFRADETEEDPGQFLAKGFNYLPLQFTVKGGYTTGNYYYTVITTGSEETADLLKYRVVLERQNSSWRLVAGPKLFLSASEYNDLDAKLLDQVNQL